VVTYRDEQEPDAGPTDEQLWSTLADGSRRSIVLRLAREPLSVGQLASGLPISRPAVSQHLKVLKDAGLVSEQADGNRRIYRLNEVGLSALRDQLDTFWRRALDGFEAAIDRNDPKTDNEE
jgi:DNA-binding transcriptional ArsR family regulator